MTIIQKSTVVNYVNKLVNSIIGGIVGLGFNCSTNDVSVTNTISCLLDSYFGGVISKASLKSSITNVNNSKVLNCSISNEITKETDTKFLIISLIKKIQQSPFQTSLFIILL